MNNNSLQVNGWPLIQGSETVTRQRLYWDSTNHGMKLNTPFEIQSRTSDHFKPKTPQVKLERNELATKYEVKVKFSVVLRNSDGQIWYRIYFKRNYSVRLITKTNSWELSSSNYNQSTVSVFCGNCFSIWHHELSLVIWTSWHCCFCW